MSKKSSTTEKEFKKTSFGQKPMRRYHDELYAEEWGYGLCQCICKKRLSR